MNASQRIVIAAISKRQFHRATVFLAEGEGIFGKLNPWAKKEQPQPVTPAQHTSEEPKVTFNVKYEEDDDFISWKRDDILTDVAELESTVRSVILKYVQGANETNWNNLPLTDYNTKFKILKESMKQTGKEVPNYELNGFETTKDVLEFFRTEKALAKKVTVLDYFEENRKFLPNNLTFAPAK
ncbi:hypothetical protein [Parasitella parasitica]|uniref:Large ribosomal subunit protein mL50 n=1 Tax=Parasitella parasitica TaxID=35722 RepID=A0A0B7NQY6_9FUNG|nr:hypothetical protein [Parasitella parasitica]